MVSTSTLIAVCVTLFITLILPLVVYIILGLKNKGCGIWSAWLLGALGFIVFQLLLRTPLLSLLSTVLPLAEFAASHYLLYSLILAFTAALVEVLARYVVAKIINDNMHLTVKKGIAAGLGHGGIESMLLIGMTYISNLVYITMINSGSFENAIAETAAAGVDTAAFYTIRDSLVNTSPAMFYLAGYERILTMIIHMALSFLVCYGVWKKAPKKALLTAFFLHWALDFIGPVLSATSTAYLGNILPEAVAYLLTYVFITGIGVLAVYIMHRIYKQWTTEDAFTK